MRKFLSVTLAMVMLILCCPYAFAAVDVYCLINDDSITAINTSLPGVQTVGDTTYHVGVGEVLSYDTHEDKEDGSMPGLFTAIPDGGYGWVKQSSLSRPIYKKDSTGDTSTVFSFEANAQNQLGYYTFNKGTGFKGKVTLEYKVKSDAATTADIRLISAGSPSLGWDQKYQLVYSFLTFEENKFTYKNTAYDASTQTDKVTNYPVAGIGLNEWITLRLDMDIDSESYDVYVNGNLLASSLPFHFANRSEDKRTDEQKAVCNLEYMRITEAKVAANVSFDDIAIYDTYSGTTHYFGGLEKVPSYSYYVGDTLHDVKAPVAITDSNGVATGKTAYVPIRLSDVSSSEFAISKATIDGYSDKATVYINKKSSIYTNDFEDYKITDVSTGLPLSVTGHSVQQETLADTSTNQFMKIYQSADWSAFVLDKSLNPGNTNFDFGCSVRFPDTTGFVKGGKFLSIQLNEGNNSNIVTLNIEPEYDSETETTSKRMQLILPTSSGTQNSYYVYAPDSTDWAQWHDVLLSFSDGKMQFKFDGNILIANGHTAWEEVRTDLDFDRIKLAHRPTAAASIKGVSNIDDIYVTSYPVINSLDNISHTTSLENITVPQNISVSLTDSTVATLPIKSLTPIDNAPEVNEISQCGTYQYAVSTEGTDKTSTLTLTVIDKAYSLGSPYTDENTGHAVVPVFKATTDTNAVSLITALYENDVLSDVSILPVSGSGNIVTPIIAKDGATVKAFLWNSLTSLTPQCGAVEEALSAATPAIEEYDIVCWGDSLTYGQTEESTLPTENSYPSVLASLTGKSVKNMGIGGETAQTIAVRQGGLTLAPSGAFTLGGAAGSSVTFTEGSFNDLTGGHIVPRSKSGYCYGWEGTCYLNGIPGTITALEVDDSVKPRKLISLTFTRSEDGDALSVKEGESRILIPNGNMVKGDINVIFIGENGWHDIDNDGDIDELDLTLILDAMIEKMPNPEKTIIIGLTTEDAESRKVMEELMESKYGDHYINLRAHLSNEETLRDAGITPTQTDLEKIEVGAFPTSLWRNETDYVHMNSKGYEIVADKIYKTMQGLGFLD